MQCTYRCSFQKIHVFICIKKRVGANTLILFPSIEKVSYFFKKKVSLFTFPFQILFTTCTLGIYPEEHLKSVSTFTCKHNISHVNAETSYVSTLYQPSNVTPQNMQVTKGTKQCQVSKGK